MLHEAIPHNSVVTKPMVHCPRQLSLIKMHDCEQEAEDTCQDEGEEPASMEAEAGTAAERAENQAEEVSLLIPTRLTVISV